MTKKDMVNSRYPDVSGQCDEACLGLRFYPVTKQTVFNVLQRISKKLIIYENAFPMKKRVLLSESQVKYVEDIIVKSDTENLGMSRKEVIQVISDIGQSKWFVQAENHLDYLIQTKRLTHLKMIGRVVKSHAMITEQ